MSEVKTAGSCPGREPSLTPLGYDPDYGLIEEASKISTLPHDWLVRRTTVEEVDEQISADGAPDSWLEQWRVFCSHVGPHDEVWRYCSFLQDDSMQVDRPDPSDMLAGFALVRDGEVVEAIPES